MRRVMAVLAVGLLVSACGGGSDDAPAVEAPTSSSTAKAAATTTSLPPVIAAALAGGAKLRRADPVDGHEVYVDDAQRLIYTDDCAVARKVTAEGEKFGPSHRDAEGNFTPGFTFICPS